MRDKKNIAALTSIRGLAAWWVVLFHFREYLPLDDVRPLGRFLAHGYLAVDLFFILSGFVIFLNYGSHFETLTRQSLGRFFVARFARIYPLHAFMMLAFLVNPLAQAFFSSSGYVDFVRYNPIYFLLSLLLVQNWGFPFPLAWNIPAWSISTEAFAYLLFPAFAYLVSKSSPRPLAMTGFSIVPLFALAGLYYATGQPSLGSGISSYGLLRCCLEFLVGASLCRIYLNGQMTFRWWPALFFTGFLALVALYNFAPVTDYLVMPTAFALLILCLALASEGAVPLLNDRVLVFLGTISYSTYLAHYFILDWVKFLFVQNDDPPLSVGIIFVAATLAASIILHFYVEIPGRRLLAGKLRGKPVPIFESSR